MSDEKDENTNSAEAANKKAQENDNLVNGIVLEFSVQKQISDTEIKELNPSSNLHAPKIEAPDSTNNLIPISPVLNDSEAKAVNTDVLILESQIKIITTFITEAKVLEIEMNKFIKAIFAKNPELKPYLLRMKKLLQDHANIEKALEAAKAKPQNTIESSEEKEAS